jgi:lipopolysaccharide biosynthesis glycosyltransferase
MSNLSEEIQQIDFLIVSDAKNVIPTSTLIYQLIELHSSVLVKIYLITPSQSDAEYFENVLTAFKIYLEILVFDSSKFVIPEKLFTEKNGVTKIAYAKIFAPKMLPNEIKKIVYLDTDILLLKPLTDLYEVDFEFSLAAAIDASDGLVGSLDDAFNSGVIVMNLDRMRKKWDDRLLIESFERNLDSHWMDMTILRSIYKNDWYELPTSFNFIINGREQRYSPEHEIAVVHFAGYPKPWHEKVDSIFFMLWSWLNRNAIKIINREIIASSQYRIFLKYAYPIINDVYHQIRSGQIKYSWRQSRFELAGTQAELAGTQAELAGTQAELAGTQAELARTQAELARTQAELARTQAELARILKSRTWRLFHFYRKFR